MTIDSAHALIRDLRAALLAEGQDFGLFGSEHGGQLAAILGGIEQTFDGRPLYPSAQSRAAHLLYFVIKDHPFADGNKRIAATRTLRCLHRRPRRRPVPASSPARPSTWASPSQRHPTAGANVYRVGRS